MQLCSQLVLRGLKTLSFHGRCLVHWRGIMLNSTHSGFGLCSIFRHLWSSPKLQPLGFLVTLQGRLASQPVSKSALWSLVSYKSSVCSLENCCFCLACCSWTVFSIVTNVESCCSVTYYFAWDLVPFSPFQFLSFSPNQWLYGQRSGPYTETDWQEQNKGWQWVMCTQINNTTALEMVIHGNNWLLYE